MRRINGRYSTEKQFIRLFHQFFVNYNKAREGFKIDKNNSSLLG